MKKTYINPELEVVKLQTMQMLASSIIVDPDPIDPGDIGAPGTDFDFSDDDAFAFEEENFDYGE